MSQILESESDGGSSSISESSVVPENQFTMQDELEQYAKKLDFLRLDGDEEPLKEMSLSSADLQESNGNIKTKEVPTFKAPMTTSVILTHLTPAGDAAIKHVISKEQQHPVKLHIKFQAIGAVPQVSPQTAQISSSQPFSVLITFLKKKLKVATVHCYVNNSFSPAPQQSVGDLWMHFKVKDELIVNYCKGVAFG
ncbi:LAME_0C07052g1_1 [Lachancea meyersii CBS 8951]|uniref:Ubiquitin-like protein ATG12 n=1 Tax=Lachancea meyersii CBS 8951 TaxID=1266667 RepID=A0A1G4J375_9SACH|nr:LAME_0C07052g1_1 [Lachancea meyersii CBS 8951]